jgi:hypothetical protein
MRQPQRVSDVIGFKIVEAVTMISCITVLHLLIQLTSNNMALKSTGRPYLSTASTYKRMALI